MVDGIDEIKLMRASGVLSIIGTSTQSGLVVADSWLGKEADMLVWATVAVVGLMLAGVGLAVFQHWLVGRRFRESRRRAEKVAKTRRRFVGDHEPRRP